MSIFVRILLIAILPTAALFALEWRGAVRSEATLAESITYSTEQSARNSISAIDQEFSTQVAIWQEILADPGIKHVLEVSNARFAEMESRETYIDEMDAAWREDPESVPMYEALMASEEAMYLRDRAEHPSRVDPRLNFGEAFVTNRYGFNVAQSNRTSDLNQADEYWWQVAMSRGLHIGGMEYDESVDELALPLALRLDDASGRPLGVMKALVQVEHIQGIVEILADTLDDRVPSTIMVVDANGALQYRHGSLDIAFPSESYEWIAHHEGTDITGRLAKEAGVSAADIVAFDARSEPQSDYLGTGWHLVVVQDRHALLEPAIALKRELLVSTSVVGLVAALGAVYAALGITRRIARLRRAADSFGNDSWELNIDDSSRDELGVLARCFTVMSHRLSDSVRALEHEIDERARLEAELVQAQKLESIGQLAAGIAHEINTPTQYVSDNTRFIDGEFSNLMGVIDSYHEVFEAAKQGPIEPSLLEAVEQTLRDADFEFLKEEIPQAVTQSLEGLERIAKIVAAMKDFSHPGTEGMEPADINKAIESTITVCRSRWKYCADLELNLDPSLPAVPCRVAEFNQVVLNIVVNAADAIAGRFEGQNEQGRIEVATRLLADSAEITITDNGGGIPESIRSKVFDPFFTTKGVGKGTGQGLAISHDVIVKQHGGELSLTVEEGEGSTFTIRLPLEAENEMQEAA